MAHGPGLTSTTVGDAPRLLRPILAAAWLSDLDLTVDPLDATNKLGPASGIYSVGGGDVKILMAGSPLPSIITLAAGGSRTVQITKLYNTGTTCMSVEVGWP